jgi:hypothetical protein
MTTVAHEPSVHPMKERAEDEDENEDEGCRLIPATYYLLPSYPSRDVEIKRRRNRRNV